MPPFAVDLAALLPYAVGVVVGLVILLVFLRTRRKTISDLNPDELLKPGDGVSTEDGFADRRGTIRRDGAPVRIFASSPTFKSKVESGWVLDRSTGGLRLALGVAVAPGSGLQVRAENAPDTIPWVTVVVRSCTNEGEHYELGCAFETTPPWNVLLLFG